MPTFVALLAVAALLLPAPCVVAADAPEETTLAVPAFSLSFSSVFLAEALGLWEKEGLRVKTSVVAGVASSNAVLAGSVDFGIGTGASLVRAAARGQKLLAVVQLMDRITADIVLRKDLADQAGLAPGLPIEKRAQALRGRRIAIDAVNALPHLVLRYVARKGGLDPDKDLIVTPMQPPNMMVALRTGAIDGFCHGMPWTVSAVRDGTAVTLVSMPRGDLAELHPFAFLLVVTRPGFCEAKPSVCRKLAGGFRRAFALIQGDAPASLAALRAKFDKTDPAVLAESFELIRRASSHTGRVSEDGLKRAIEFQVDAGVMKPDERVPALSTLYTNAFVP